MAEDGVRRPLLAVCRGCGSLGAVSMACMAFRYLFCRAVKYCMLSGWKTSRNRMTPTPPTLAIMSAPHMTSSRCTLRAEP